MSVDVTTVTSPIWEELMDKPVVDRSIFKTSHTMIYDSNSHGATYNDNGTSTQQINFILDKREDYIDLHNAYIRWRGKIVKKSDGTDFATGDLNDILGVPGFMFRDAKLEVSGKQLEYVQDVFLQNCFLMHLTNRTTDPVAKELTWYYPETDLTEPYGRIGGINRDTANPGAAYPASLSSVYKSRLARRNGINRKFDDDDDFLADGLSNPSKEFEIIIPLKDIFGFFRDNIAPIVSNSIKIELTLVKDRVIKGFKQTAQYGPNTQVDGRVKTTYLQLEFDTVTPSPETDKMLYEFKQNPGKIDRMWRRYDVGQFGGNFFTTQGQINAQLGTYTSFPNIVYVAVQSKQKFDGSRQEFNRSTFDMLKFSEVSLLINGTLTVPSTPWEYKITDRIAIQMYNEFVKAQRKYSDEDSGLMSYNEWFQTYPILAFDLTTVGDQKFKGVANTIIQFKATYSQTPVAHPYSFINGNQTRFAADAGGVVTDSDLTADAQNYFFIKCVEVPCSVSVDLTSGSMLFDNLVN